MTTDIGTPDGGLKGSAASSLERAEAPPGAQEATSTVPKHSFLVRLVAIAVPIGICLSGTAMAGLLVATRPEAARTEREQRGLPVRAEEVFPTTESVVVRAQGQVIAAQKVLVQPELTGRVIWMNENLIPGGHVASGETLLRIDPRDYQSALESQRAQLESRRVQIRQEQAQQVIAQREWALLRDEVRTSEEGRDLALREPQIRSAEAALRAAESSVRQARTNLTRTNVIAPFDAVVQAENVDLGQLVSPSTQLATLVGTEHFWVQVSLPVEQLGSIRIPSAHGEEGSPATVIQAVGEDQQIVRYGRVLRVLGDLDPVGRMARILVEIDDPLGLEQPLGERSLPMLLGAFVRVEIAAGELEDVFEVPREALHAGDHVYLVDDDSRLEVRPVEVVWRREQSVLVRGLNPGERLVLSQIPTPVGGSLLRQVEEEESEASDEGQTQAESPDER